MKTADLMDDFQDELESCDIQFSNFGGKTTFWGRVKTLQCFHDNVLLKQILSSPANGDVLVVDGGGSISHALIGDIIAGLGVENNWSGVVIYGAVRDREELSKMDFGVKALGSNPRKSYKKGNGRVDIEVGFGGMTVVTGDWIYCDIDGIVAAKRELPL